MRIRRRGREVLSGYDSMGGICIQVALGRYMSMDSAFTRSSNAVILMASKWFARMFHVKTFAISLV